QTLSGWHLLMLGIGAIVGTGIYTLIGDAAGRAGPAVILSFAIAGAVCACAALAYAELSTMMPASGSSYTYAYASMGELAAWIVGWALILEYTVVCSAVAVGWSGYAVGFINEIGKAVGFALPPELTAASGQLVGALVDGVFVPKTAFLDGLPPDGSEAVYGLFNAPAVFIIGVVAAMLLVGTKESATVNAVLVVVKLAALAVFVALALPAFDASNFSPFMPYGFASHDALVGDSHMTQGVMAAASIIFFAFYGFDAVSTAAEETKDPGRNLAFGIVGSLIACTIIYMTVAAAALGALPHSTLAASSEPLALVLRELGHPGIAVAVAGAAVIAVPTVILAFMFGQSRIFFVMARDGLLPRNLGVIDAKSGSPALMTIFTAIVCAAIAALLPLGQIAALANAGTLAAFIATGAALIILRRREPARARPFRAPAGVIVGILTILGCLYLFYSLPHQTQVNFFIWMAIGLPVYFLYGAWSSGLARKP
ncbi:MAG: amino acid permease, partial [Parvularculaceae bacterium]|nr:amino acid permease [Parvularculaceae bacterium]